jgi:hypothetical protein
MKHLSLIITSILLLVSLSFGGTDYLTAHVDTVKAQHVSLDSLKSIATNDAIKELTVKMYDSYGDYVDLMNAQSARVELQRRGIEFELPFSEEKLELYVMITAGMVAEHINRINDKPEERKFIKYFMNVDKDFARNVYDMYLTLSSR